MRNNNIKLRINSTSKINKQRNSSQEKRRQEERTLENTLYKKINYKKIEPVIKDIMHKFLGVNIEELVEDLSKKITNKGFLNVDVDTSLSFKDSKKKFKIDFVSWLLRMNHANISFVAKIARVDRRSIHRIINEGKINVDRMRKELLKPSYIKKVMVNTIVEDVLSNYSSIIHPIKLNNVYHNVESVSTDIIEELNTSFISLKEAEILFEKEYIKKVLKENDFDLSKTSKNIKLRHETLYRKAKRYGLI